MTSLQIRDVDQRSIRVAVERDRVTPELLGYFAGRPIRVSFPWDSSQDRLSKSRVDSGRPDVSDRGRCWPGPGPRPPP